MKVTWLGQAGLLFETDDVRIMIDPYFSNSVEKVNPNNFRRIPVDERFLKVKPDVMIFTHDHLDHYDPETVANFIGKDTDITVLAPKSVWQKIRLLGGKNNYVQFDRMTEWTEGDIRFIAVKAVHSDESAIGVVIKTLDKVYYITGDTLYNREIFHDLPCHIDYVFLPVNGVGNNMNMIDAKRFCSKINATAIPIHYGMFDEIYIQEFCYAKKIILECYQETHLLGELKK